MRVRSRTIVAVVDKQPQFANQPQFAPRPIEGRCRQMRLAPSRMGDRERVDRVGLAGLAVSTPVLPPVVVGEPNDR